MTRKSTQKLIAAFFEANPTEELTLPDMMLKFDSSENAVRMALERLRAEGLVERVVIYRMSETVAA